MELHKVIGIISWLPDNPVQRSARIRRFSGLLASIDKYFTDIDILIIAQNWREYLPKEQSNKFIIYKYDKLGILKARKELRKRFLELGYDYIIMFDDDAIIESKQDNLVAEYCKRMDENPNGFAFVKSNGSRDLTGLNPYCPSQLNMCAISRYIYEREDMVNLDAQKDEGYEDNIFSLLLHYKYKNLEFNVPDGLRSVHFKNPNINKLGGEVPSTWAGEKRRNWQEINKRTIALQEYIIINKTLPPDIKEFLRAKGLM